MTCQFDFYEGKYKMEVILTSVFSAIIILITVFFMMKVFIITYKRKEISLRKFIMLSVSSIVIGVIVASVLPFGYQKIYQYF
jgi:FtsH-binding integral membrane protein